MQVGAEIADAFQQIERAHDVDIKELAIVEGPAEGRRQVIDGVDARHRVLYILRVTQVTEDCFHVGEGVQFAGAAGIAGVDEAAYLVPLFQQAHDQIGADASRGAGDQNLHRLPPLLPRASRPFWQCVRQRARLCGGN